MCDERSHCARGDLCEYTLFLADLTALRNTSTTGFLTSAVPKPPRRTAAAATATVAVVVLGLAAAPSSARAQPDPTPDPRVHVRSRTLVRARQIRTPGGGLEDQRSFGQRVDPRPVS